MTTQQGGADRVAAELEALADLIERDGLDGLLAAVVLACQARERIAEHAKQWDDRNKWKARAYHCRAYKTMARRVEGREG